MGIWEIVAVLGSFLAALVALAVFVERQIMRKINKQKEEDIEKMAEYVESSARIITPRLHEYIEDKLVDYLLRDEGVELKSTMTEQIGDIQKSIHSNHQQLLATELFRLQGEILDFYEDLKNGSEKSSVSYKHIHDAYRRYRELNGNSYICGVFDLIKQIQNREIEVHKREDREQNENKEV